MKSMDKIIGKDLFINACQICKDYAESKVLNDINFLLLKKDLINLNKKKIENYYNEYIKNDIFYGNPVLFATDIVHIPKGIDGFREYRFFDLYSMILYNSVGILFYKICNPTLSNLNPNKDCIYKYSPTIFTDDCNSIYKNNYIPVKANKDYRNDYINYQKKLKEKLTKNKCAIKIDLSKYFDSISHNKLVSLLSKYSLDSTLAEYDIDKDSIKSLKFYFESMMNSKFGIPQGRDNCFSDYFGDIYLRQFDFAVKDLCENDYLNFNSMIRYVDDITIVFDVNEEHNIPKHYKVLSSIAQKISKYLLNELNLNVNPSKTKFVYFQTDKEAKKYLNNECKKVSTKNDIKVEKNNIQNMYQKFKNTLNKFKFSSDNNYSFSLSIEDRENLKYIFNNNFRKYLCKENNVKEINNIISKIDLELSADSMYVLIILFFIKSKQKKIYFEKFKENININLNLIDKRTIHIIMMAYTQNESLEGLKNSIKKSKKNLENDNYGKYLLPLSGYYEYKDVSYLNEMSIYNMISWRYITKEKKLKILPKNDSQSMYNKIFDLFCNLSKNSKEKINSAQIQQLIDFVYYYRKCEWNLAYNSFYNFFHETCKIIFLKNKKNNNYDIKDMINDLYNKKIINQNCELILNKFADSRNFNSISHPSKNGKMSIKVSKDKLNYFINEIGVILCKILELDNL